MAGPGYRQARSGMGIRDQGSGGCVLGDTPPGCPAGPAALLLFPPRKAEIQAWVSWVVFLFV